MEPDEAPVLTDAEAPPAFACRGAAFQREPPWAYAQMLARNGARLAERFTQGHLEKLLYALSIGNDDDDACIYAGLKPAAMRTLEAASNSGDERAGHWWSAILQAKTYYNMGVVADYNKAAAGWEAGKSRTATRRYQKGGQEVTEETSVKETAHQFSPEAAMKRGERIKPERLADQLQRRLARMNDAELDAFILGGGSAAGDRDALPAEFTVEPAEPLSASPALPGADREQVEVQRHDPVQHEEHRHSEAEHP